MTPACVYCGEDAGAFDEHAECVERALHDPETLADAGEPAVCPDCGGPISSSVEDFYCAELCGWSRQRDGAGEPARIGATELLPLTITATPAPSDGLTIGLARGADRLELATVANTADTGRLLGELATLLGRLPTGGPFRWRTVPIRREAGR